MPITRHRTGALWGLAPPDHADAADAADAVRFRRRRADRRGGRLVASSLAVLGLAGSTAVFTEAAGAAAPTLSWTACPTEVRTGPGPEDLLDVPVECSHLDVPLDHTRPEAGTVRLAVFRIRTAEPSQRLGHLLTNPGGPGGATKDFLAHLSTGLSPAVRERYDLVSFDPRGVGESEGLECGLDDDLVAEQDDPIGRQRRYGDELVAECLAEVTTEFLAGMSGTNAAHDMESVRQALGDRQLTYLGYSYGTVIGSVYAELYGQHVGRMVLDGALDPNESYREWVSRQVIGFEGAFRRFADWCDSTPECRFPGITTAEVWEYLSWRAGESGLPVADGPPVTRREFETSTILGGYLPDEAWPMLADALHAAFEGDAGFYRSFWQLLSEGFSAGSYYAGVCGDDAHRFGADWEVLEAIRAVMDEAPHVYWALRELITCSSFPAPTAPLPAVDLAAGELPPVVVVGNRFDPVTPYSGSVRLSEILTGSSLVTFEGGGHTIVFQGVPCVDEAIAAYLVDGTVPPAGLSCQAPTEPTGPQAGQP